LPVSVSIVSNDGDNTICTGTSVTFTATPVNGGTTPGYQWKLNGVDVGTSSATYTINSLANGDVVSVVMTTSSSYPCLNQNIATSNAIASQVDPLSVAGNISITSGSSPLCNNTSKPTISLIGNTGSTITWQSSSTSATGYNNITPLQNGTTINSVINNVATTIPVTTYYQAVIKSGVCAAVITNEVSVTVDPTSQVAPIASNQKVQEICIGGNAIDVVLPSHVGAIIWQSSNSLNGVYTNLTGPQTNATLLKSSINTSVANTLYYKAVVTSGVCPSTNSEIVSVQVDPLSVAGTISITSGSSPLCNNSTKPTISLNGNTGTTITWQSSLASITGYSNISPVQNGNSINSVINNVATIIPVTTYYQAIVQSGVCPFVITNEVSVTVDPPSQVGAIAPNQKVQEVCIGSNAIDVVLPSHVGTIIWKTATNLNGPYANMVGPYTGTTLPFSAIGTSVANTLYYKAVVTSGVCPSISSDIVSMQVDAATVAGDIAFTIGNTPICNNGDKPTVALSGNTGNTIIWQSSKLAGSGFVDISPSETGVTINNGLSNVGSGLFSTFTYYRATVKNGACNTEYTAPIVLEVIPSPVVTTIQNAGRCGPGVVTLFATSNLGGVTWFDAASNGTLLSSNSNYTTPELEFTRKYYVEAAYKGCPSLARTEVNVAIKTIPTITSVTNNVKCGPGSLLLSATASEGSVKWYETASSISVLANSNDFSTPSINATRDYFAEAFSNGCASILRTAVNATTNDLPVFFITNPAQICYPNTVDITKITTVVSASSALTYSYWKNAGSSSGITIPTAIGVSGTFYVKAIDIHGCFDVKPVNVVVNALPPSPIPKNDIYCLNDNTANVFANVLADHKLQWYDVNTAGAYFVIGNPKPSSSTAGTYSYFVSQISNITGCESPKVNLDVVTNPLPVVTINASQNPICYGSDLILKGIGASSYLWDKGVIDNVSFKILTSDKYNVIGTDLNGCKNNASIDIVVKELPVASELIIPYNLCVGNIFSLFKYVTKGQGPYQFFITSDNANIASYANGNILGMHGGSTKLSYQVKDVNGCLSNLANTVNIKIFEPVASQIFNYEAFYNDNFLIPTKTDSGYTFYDWSPKISLNFYDNKNPTFNGEDRVNYMLRRTDLVSKCYVLDQYNVNVTKDKVLLLPNAFTPNEDGLNDKLRVINNQGILSIISFKIYNRSGKMVFQTADMNEGWDGKVGGYMQESDAYYWIVQYVTKTGETLRKSGSVLLLK